MQLSSIQQQQQQQYEQSLEPLPFDSLGLEFPSLISRGTSKRSAQAPSFPAKRRKGLLCQEGTAEDKEDNSWMDSFSLLDSLYPEDFKPTEASFPDPSSLWKNDQASVKDLIRKALDVSSPDVFNAEPLPVVATSAQAQAYTANSSSYGGYNSNLMGAPQVQPSYTEIPTLPPPAPLVSPCLNPSQSLNDRHQSPISTTVTTQEDYCDSSAFTISKLKNSKEPTLLTLTSYPFRVVYSNEAFSKLVSSPKCVIGDSIFDTFQMEGRVLRPSLATYPTLTGRLDNQVALVNNSNNLRCGLQAYPVTKRSDPNSLRYFAIRFTPL